MAGKNNRLVFDDIAFNQAHVIHDPRAAMDNPVGRRPGAAGKAGVRSLAF